MIKKLHAISVYDYVDMLNEEIGFKWNDDNIWFPNKHLYNGQDNIINNGRSSSETKRKNRNS